MTDVFAVLFLMDHITNFSLMLALADKDLIFAWQAKWVQPTTANWPVFFLVGLDWTPFSWLTCTNWWMLAKHCCSICTSTSVMKIYFYSSFLQLHFNTSIRSTNAIRGTFKLPNQKEHKAGFYLLYIAKKNGAISQIFKHVILPCHLVGEGQLSFFSSITGPHRSPDIFGLVWINTVKQCPGSLYHTGPVSERKGNCSSNPSNSDTHTHTHTRQTLIHIMMKGDTERLHKCEIKCNNTPLIDMSVSMWSHVTQGKSTRDGPVYCSRLLVYIFQQYAGPLPHHSSVTWKGIYCIFQKVLSNCVEETKAFLPSIILNQLI